VTRSRCCTTGNGTESDFDCRVIASTPRPRECGLALADYLAIRFSYRPHAAWRASIAAGEFTVNGEAADPERPVASGDRIEWRPGALPEPEVELSYRVLFADGDLLAVDKPGNLPVHPAGPFFRHTLWHILHREFGPVFPVNRIDRETSGVVLFARSPEMAARLARELPHMEKRYWVIVRGTLPERLCADGFLSPDPASAVRKKQRWGVDPGVAGALSARTDFRRLRQDGLHTLAEARLFTGRMHQIRASLCSLGFPVVGDKLYGRDERLFLKIRSGALTPEDFRLLEMGRQALHAWRLRCRDPRAAGRWLEWETPCPEDFLLRPPEK